MKTSPMKNRMSIAAAAFLVSGLAATAAFAQDHAMAGHAGHGGMMDMMQAMDSNHDGMISAAEHAAAAKAMFDKADGNHDGMVDKAEMQAAMKAMHEKHEAHERMDKGHDMKGHDMKSHDMKSGDMKSDDMDSDDATEQQGSMDKDDDSSAGNP